MLKILTVPQDTKILRTKSRPVEKIDAEVLAFLKELGKTLKGQKDPAGVGLSAIQVGRAIRVFAMYLPKVNKGPALPATPAGGPRQGRALLNAKPELTFYINPEIVGHPEEMTLGEELPENREQRKVNRNVQLPASSFQRPFLEGCLSIPQIYGAVLRYPWIKAKATVIAENDFLTPSAFYLLPSSLTLNALASRVFQHELDHLNGILFTDHVLAQGNKLYREEDKEMAEMEI